MSGTENEPKQLSCENQARLQGLVDKTCRPAMVLKMWERLDTEERQKLGGNGVADVKGFASAGDVYCKLYGGSPAEAVIKAAARLKLIDGDTRAELLRELYRVEGHRGAGSVPFLDVVPEHADAELKNAIAANRLVIVEGSGIRCLVWDGEHIDIEWSKNPRAWEFLWEMVLAACRGRAVDRFSFGPETRPLKERLQGLKRALSKCSEIDELSKPLVSLISQPDKESYRLSVPSDKIWQRRLVGDRWELDFEDIPSLDETIHSERAKLKQELRHNK